jgi:hypothetical protein
MIIATFWGHHRAAHIGTCAIWWWWRKMLSWHCCRIAWWNNAITSWVTRHREARLTRRRHHFSGTIMRCHSCIGKTLAHVTHGIHNGSRHIHTWRHHHGGSILHHGAHFRTTRVSGSHVHTTTNNRTERVTRGVKCLW